MLVYLKRPSYASRDNQFHLPDDGNKTDATEVYVNENNKEEGGKGF